MEKELIHFQPFGDTFNVKCLNGSAHAHRTKFKEFVTCPLCLKPETNKDFWSEYENKHGNVYKNM